jgi:exocyst complex component 6
MEEGKSQIASDDIDEDVIDILGAKGLDTAVKEDTAVVMSRARRRREEAVRRLVADVHRRPDPTGFQMDSHEWVVASTVATALERGLDKDLHAELVQEAKENSARIGQVCHDHSDAFLASVGRVVALGEPAKELSLTLERNNQVLQNDTAGRMLMAAALLEHSRLANQRARTLAGMVTACRNVAVLLERARKQAALGRPRAALDAVDEARTCLNAPVSSLILGSTSQNRISSASEDTMSLEETPFGRRAIVMLPKIENEVIIGARRGLNRWFLALRSGGDGAKAGRAVLRKCAQSMSIGPGQLGLGGHLPPSYIWRAKVADNLLARIDQSGKVARAVRQGYWYERDANKEAQRLEAMTRLGMARRAEAFALAFGWYRCWDESAPLMVDIHELNLHVENQNLSGSRHGGSRHGKRGNLSFRGANRAPPTGTIASKQQMVVSKDGSDQAHSSWATLLTPPILFHDYPTRYVTKCIHLQRIFAYPHVVCMKQKRG